MKAAPGGSLWPAAWLNVSNERYHRLCPRCLAEGTQAEETMLRSVWHCPCNPTGGILSVTEVACEGRGTTHHGGMFRDAWPGAYNLDSRGERRDQNPSVFGVTWKLDIHHSDGSGGKYSQRGVTATCGMEHCLLGSKCRTEKKPAWADVQGRQTVQRVELMALVVLAETIEAAGLYVVRVQAQYLLTSTGRPERAKRGVNGDFCARFFESRVTRLSRSHLTAKELDIDCSTRFDMRGDIIEANLAAIFAQPKREFLPMRTPAHRKTRQQRRVEPLELLHVSGHVLKRRSGKT